MNDLQPRLQAALGDAFVIERELQGGGMSRLFLATEASLNRRVVIKLLPPEFTSAVSAARFKQEMEFAARLQHPHILPVLAAGARDGLLYYIMPFVAGESLRQRLEREGALLIPETIRLLGELCDALAFAHGEGVIHRDLKPENILLEGRHVVLADFGIARALVSSRTGERLTATGLTVGTPGYMSPEQVAGDDVDARADVYALAVVAYEMLTGHPPFSGSSAQAVLTAHLAEVPRPLEQVRPETPPRLAAAIARALAKRPADRFRTVAEFGEALPSVTPVSGSEQPARAPTRHRTWSRIAIVLAVAAAGTLLVRELNRRRTVERMLTTLGPLIAAREFDSVASELRQSGLDLRDRGLATLAAQVAGSLKVTSEPAGALVSVRRVDALARLDSSVPMDLGATPMAVAPLVAGEYLLRLVGARSESLTLLVQLTPGDTVAIHRVLPSQDSASTGMVLVAAGPARDGTAVPGFLVGRTEVTNAEFLVFVNDGGYRLPGLWPDTLMVGGRTLPRDAALALMIDRSGLPGPRSWNGGRFPEGQASHPVTGVSWYEASAYARWRGGALPTAGQWWRAAIGDGRGGAYPWGNDGATLDARANFGLAGTTPVGALPLGVSPWGAMDLAGNVREWLLDLKPGSTLHAVVGGSWQDPSYMFDRSPPDAFDPGAGSGIIGFRIVKPAPAGSR